MKFTDFTLDADILKGLEEAGFTDCTRVQELTIQAVVQEGRDITVQSKTGTGKTAAFLLPAFQLLKTNPDFKDRKVLVLAPTRELAVQIEEEARMLGAFLGLRMGAVYGGVAYGQQEDLLRSGVDVLIATPGRLMDFMDSRKVDLRDFSIVVIDEADRLLDMGFYPDIKRILSRCVPRDQRRTMLLSATMSTRVSNIAWEHMNDPVSIVIEADTLTVDAIDQKLYHLSSDEKVPFLVGYLKKFQPSNALIFTNTKRKAEELSRRLDMNGFPSCFLMGDLAQKKRLAVINDVKAGKVRFLVATDVAARGLHIDDLDLVVNYDLPEDPENYVHRIGRTARAGKSGTAISLSCERFVYALPAIEKYINMKVPVGDVTEDLMGKDASKGIRIHLSSWDDEDFDGRRHPAGGRDGNRGPGRGDSSGPRSRGPRPEGDRNGRNGPRHHDGEGRPAAPRAGGHRPGESAPRQAGAGRNGPPPVRTVEERLEHYRQKYGDSFVPTPELLERLRRDEERSKEQRTRNLSSRKPSAGQGTRKEPPRGDRPSGNRPQEQGRKRKPVAAPAAPAAPVRTEPAPKAESQGIMGWIRKLFRKG